MVVFVYFRVVAPRGAPDRIPLTRRPLGPGAGIPRQPARPLWLGSRCWRVSVNPLGGNRNWKEDRGTYTGCLKRSKKNRNGVAP